MKDTENFEVTVPKNVNGWFNQKIFEKKSHKAKKYQVKNTKIAKGLSLVCFRASGRRFCFGQGSEVFSVLDIRSLSWTELACRGHASALKGGLFRIFNISVEKHQKN